MNKQPFLRWLGWLSPGKEKRASEVLLEWPYDRTPHMTPDVVWSAYVHENRLRLLWELELKRCTKRLHEQRLEINRLNDVIKELKDKP